MLTTVLENTILQRKLKLADYQIKQDELDVMLDLEKTRRKKLDTQRMKFEALIAELKKNIDDKDKAKELFVTDVESSARPRASTTSSPCR